MSLAGLSWPLADALTTQGFQSRRAGVQTAAVVVEAGAYWFLGRAFGAAGAAGAALAVEAVLVTGFLAANPGAVALVREALAPLVPKAAAMVGLAWAVRKVVGSTWLGLGLTVVAIGGISWALDKEIRGYVRLLLLVLWREVRHGIERLIGRTT